MFYESEASPPLLSQSISFFKCPRILLFQRTGSFDVKLSASRNLHVDRQRALEVTISSGWNDITSGELHIRAATAGLRVQTGETKLLDGEVDLARKSDPGVIHFGPLSSESVVKLSLPFSLEHESSAISLRLEISYKVGDETFFYASNPTISVLLPLRVNVQDVFKQKALFSKFSISSATSNPLRLLSSSLTDSDVFEARNGGELIDPIIIYPRQSASLLYRITRRKSPIIPSGGKKAQKSALQLKLHYICLDEEIDAAVTSAISVALADTTLSQYTRLITPALLSQLHSRLSPYDLERAALLGELSTATLLGAQWPVHFHDLHHPSPTIDIALRISDWISAFLTAHPTITLPPPAITPATIASRSITMPVAVPSVSVVHTADLRLAPSLVPAPDGEVVALLNQPIAATLVLRHTRVWDVGEGGNAGRELGFTYEVSAPGDTWLLGGRRKGGFVVPAGKGEGEGKGREMEFPVLMVPLREGFVTFPQVEIRAVVGRREEGEEREREREEKVTSEVEYKNAAMLVRVCSGAAKTTVSLDASGPQGGAWLLESERRVI
jgi:hypothetical protein